MHTDILRTTLRNGPATERAAGAASRPAAAARRRMTRPAAALVTLLSVVVAHTAVAGSAGADHGGVHFVNVVGAIKVVDDDSGLFGSADDVRSYRFGGSVELRRADGWRTVVRRSFCSDEVRVELTAWVQLVPGGVSTTQFAMLYEGASCDTDDLDGWAGGDIPATVFGHPVHIVDSFRVSNHDEGGDYADIELCVESDDIAGDQRCDLILR